MTGWLIALGFAAAMIPVLWWLTTRGDLPRAKRAEIGWGTRLLWALIVGGLVGMVVWTVFLEPNPGW